MPRVPKVRKYAEIALQDGSVLQCYVFVEATTRIQDVLNAPIPFMPVIDTEERIHLLNKSAITRVLPYDG